ncbi:MAG TPA: IS481 family transposase [Thermoanaerobaculia bacterium]|nr:IS481 family transposase [Thermoanaerobaculia bacterium]
MPLKARTIVELREEVVLRVKAGLGISEVARMYGLSRPTVYAWMERYGEGGVEGLEDRSRAPKSSPARTHEEIERVLIEERIKWGFGSKAILQRLREEHSDIDWPARSTVDGIFKRAGLSEPRRKRERKRITPFVRPYEAKKSGELLTVDFKGQFRLRNGKLCYPLTIVDRVSRYVLACEALPSTHLEPAWAVIERVLREWGLPDAVQSDNGPPFGAKGYGRLSTMSVRFMKFGVLPVFSRPGKPQDNGAHERMHRVLKETATIPPGRSFREQQQKLDAFRATYNHERPHEGLGMRRPARVWRGGRRPFPSTIAEFRYKPWFEVRQIGHSGMLKWNKQEIFISHAFATEQVGLEPVDAHRWNMFFGPFYLGRLDVRAGVLI